MSIEPSTPQYLENRFYRNEFFEALSIAEEALLMPLSYGTASFLQSVCYSYEPDTHGASSCSIAEIAYRILQGTLSLILMIVSLVPALLSLPLRVIATLGKKEFTYIQPQAIEETPSPIKKHFEIKTHNLCALPDPVGIYNKLPSLHLRSKEWMRYVVEEQDADCLCLQELGDRKTIQQITSQCKKKYPYMIIDVAAQTFGVGSGLAILSKYPIEDPQFWAYKDAAGLDALSKKGVLGVRIRLPNTNHITVFNTHLQSQTGSSLFEDIRAKQLAFLESLYPTYSKKETLSVITAGDFNLSPYIEEANENPEWLKESSQRFFQQINHSYPAQEPIGTLWQENTPYTCWNHDRFSQWSLFPWQVDHIVAWKNAPVLPGHFQIDKTMGKSSDHIAGSLTLTLDQY